MDKEHEDALKLTRDELLAKLAAGRPVELARAAMSDAFTVTPSILISPRLAAPTVLPRPDVLATA